VGNASSAIGKSRPAALRLITTGARSASPPRSVVETQIGEDYGCFRELFRLRLGYTSVSLGPMPPSPSLSRIS
jgi:hypothetical protein